MGSMLGRFGTELAALGLSAVLGFAAYAGLAAATNGGLAASRSGQSAELTIRGANPRALSIGDIDAIARTVSGISVISRLVSDTDGAVLTDAAPRAEVEGVDPSFAQIGGNSVTRGGFFTAQDGTSANRVAVVGQTVAANLFPKDQSPIGQTIRIRNLPFTVIGVLSGQVDLGAAGPDNTVLVPFQTGQVRLFGTRSVYEVVLQLADASQASAVRDQVQQLLRQRHAVGPAQANDFTIRTDSSSGRVWSGGPLQAAARVLQLVEQYTCSAKGLCTTKP